MDILLQSDGQLYPPKHSQSPPPEKKQPPAAPTEAAPSLPPAVSVAKEEGLSSRSLEDLLLLGIAFLVFRSAEKPDIPLLLALAYVLFDPQFSFFSHGSPS